jgi:hypothetical protein
MKIISESVSQANTHTTSSKVGIGDYCTGSPPLMPIKFKRKEKNNNLMDELF